MHHLKQTTTMQILPPPNPFLQFNNLLVENRNGTMNPEMSDHSGANTEIEFQTRSDFILHSPSLWTQRASKDQAYYHPSPRSRRKAIVDGQRKLMEMIRSMPESSLELSLKDIVLDNPQGTGDDDDEGHREVVGVEDKAKDKKMKRKRTTAFKHAKITRSESMDSGVFLLKMFVPLSLYTKTKSSKTKSCSKISPNPPSKQTPKPAATKDWWKMIYLHIKHNSYSRSIKRSLSSISIKESISRRNESRLVESSSLLDETSKNQRGCLF